MIKGWLNDFIGLVGLAMVFAGTWWLAPPWSLVITGVIILLIGINVDTRSD